MRQFEIYKIETATEGSKELLTVSKIRSGFILNMHSIMAESPIDNEFERYK